MAANLGCRRLSAGDRSFLGEHRDNVDVRLSRHVPRCIEAQVDSLRGPANFIYQIEDDHTLPVAFGSVPGEGRLRFCTPERTGLRLTVYKRRCRARSSIWVSFPAARSLRPATATSRTCASICSFPSIFREFVELDGDAPEPAKMSIGIVGGAEPVAAPIPGAFSLSVTFDDAVLEYDLRQAPKGYYVKRAACGGAPPADAASPMEMSTRMWGGPVGARGTFATSITPGKYLVLATTTWLDLNTETVALFWRARSKATEVEIGPGANANVRLAVTRID